MTSSSEMATLRQAAGSNGCVGRHQVEACNFPPGQCLLAYLDNHPTLAKAANSLAVVHAQSVGAFRRNEAGCIVVRVQHAGGQV